MTNLALCITDLNVGGAERCFVELAARLDRRRFSPVAYCLAAAPRSGEPGLIPALEAAGVTVECFNAGKAADFPRVASDMARALRKRDTQLIQTFLFHGNIVGRIAAWRAGVGRVACGIRVAERGARWHLWLDRLTHRMVDRYVCVSQAVARFSTETARLPAEKLIVIPNGIDAARFRDVAPADLADLRLVGQRLITFVGRLDAQKSPGKLLETAAAWLPRLPDCDLLLVGTGPQEALLRRQAENSGAAKSLATPSGEHWQLFDRPLSDRFHFLGWRADIPAILAASSLLVLPSAWEGMPNVVLEAMASGLPVAVTRVEGIEELLGPTAQEQSVNYGDWKAFSDMIVRTMSDQQLAERLGRSNRERALNRFSVAGMVESYQSLWQSLLTG